MEKFEFGLVYKIRGKLREYSDLHLCESCENMHELTNLYKYVLHVFCTADNL